MKPRLINDAFPSGSSSKCCCRSEGVEAADEGWSKGCGKTVLVIRLLLPYLFIARYQYSISMMRY